MGFQSKRSGVDLRVLCAGWCPKNRPTKAVLDLTNFSLDLRDHVQINKNCSPIGMSSAEKFHIILIENGNLRTYLASFEQRPETHTPFPGASSMNAQYRERRQPEEASQTAETAVMDLKVRSPQSVAQDQNAIDPRSDFCLAQLDHSSRLMPTAMMVSQHHSFNDPGPDNERSKKRPRSDDELIQISSEEERQQPQQSPSIASLHPSQEPNTPSQVRRSAPTEDTSSLRHDMYLLETVIQQQGLHIADPDRTVEKLSQDAATRWQAHQYSSQTLSLPQSEAMIVDLIQNVMAKKTKEVAGALNDCRKGAMYKLGKEKQHITERCMQNTDILLQSHKNEMEHQFKQLERRFE